MTFDVGLLNRSAYGVTTGVSANIKRFSIELRILQSNHACHCFFETSECLFAFWRPLELDVSSLLSFYVANIQ